MVRANDPADRRRATLSVIAGILHRDRYGDCSAAYYGEALSAAQTKWRGYAVSNFGNKPAKLHRMISGIDIRCAANLLIRQHGAYAEIEAARLADLMLERRRRSHRVAADKAVDHGFAEAASRSAPLNVRSLVRSA
jgi:hypothetical protein